jgi:rhodanese-related sulfurtransferase
MAIEKGELSPRKQIFSHFAIIGKAVSHEHRQEMLEHLGQGERSVDGLAKIAGLSIANASQHLQHLRRAGLVVSRRSGQQILYSLTSDLVVDLLATIRRIGLNNLAEVGKIVSDHFESQDSLEAITREELLVRIRNGQAMVIDVRPASEYLSGHVKNSTNIPVAELDRELKNLPKDQTIVAYCRGPYCALAYQAVKKLRINGYDARRLEDGFPEWRVAGLPVE